MPSIAEQLQSAIQDFADFNKKMIGPESMGGAMRQFELMLKKNADMLEDLNKSGELTEDAFKALDKQIEKTRVKGFGALEKDTFRKHFKVMEEASKAMTGFTGGLKNSIRSITKFIPLVGDKIAKSFDTVIDKKIGPRLQKMFMNVFGKRRKGGGDMFSGLSLGKMGLWGGVALALISIVKSLNMAENQLVAIVKGTGFLRKDMGKLVNETNEFEYSLMMSGASLDDITQTQIALINQFGQINQVTAEMVNTTQKWQLALGLSTEEAAEMMETMTRGWGATNKEIKFFTANVAANADIHGVGLSMVMREIAKDANLLSLYTKDTSHRLAEAAIQSRVIGVDLSESVNFADQFLDFGEASNKAMKMRLGLGTKLNAHDLHNLAMFGKTAELQFRMGKEMVASGKWATLEYGERKKIAAEMGVSVDWLQKTYNLGLLTEKKYQKQLADQKALNKLIDDNRRIWDTVWDILRGAIMPLLKSMGGLLESGLKPIVNDIATTIRDWFAPAKDEKAWTTLKNGFGKVFDWLGDKLVRVLDYALDKIGSRSGALGFLLGSSSGSKRLSLGSAIPGPRERLEDTLGSSALAATGGIVTRPTKAIIGEAGPEMVIPLKGSGLDYSKGSGFKFARGAFITPIDRRKGLADVGSSMASGDPIARMERRKAAQEFAKSQAKEEKQRRDYWKKEEEERKRRKKDYRRFSSGVSIFGRASDSLKAAFGKSFSTLLANKIGEAFGISGVGDLIGSFQNARKENSVSAWARFASGAAVSLGYNNLATSITQGVGVYEQGKQFINNVKSGNIAGATANVVAGRNSWNQFTNSGLFNRVPGTSALASQTIADVAPAARSMSGLASGNMAFSMGGLSSRATSSGFNLNAAANSPLADVSPGFRSVSGMTPGNISPEMGGLATKPTGVVGGAKRAFGLAKAGFKTVGTKAKNLGKVFTKPFQKGGALGGIGESLGKVKIPGIGALGEAKIPGGMGGVMMGVGALSSIMQGDYKGAAVGLAKGLAAKAIYGVPGIGQIAMIGDLMGFGVTDKAFSIVSGSIKGGMKAFTGGIKNMGGGVKKLFSGNIGGGIKDIGKGVYGATVGTAVGHIKGFGGAVGGVVGGMLGLGKKATIETSWHPALLAHLFANRYKLRDKVKKSEIKRINQSLGFANGYVPGSKDGFSKYNVKGDEEKFEKQKAKSADWKSWALQRSSQIWGVPAMASGGIVSRPTLALVGESGSEAVVPLGGGGNNDLLGAINGLRSDIQALANRPIEMDGRRVSAVVSENFFEMAQQ